MFNLLPSSQKEKTQRECMDPAIIVQCVGQISPCFHHASAPLFTSFALTANYDAMHDAHRICEYCLRFLFLPLMVHGHSRDWGEQQTQLQNSARWRRKAECFCRNFLQNVQLFSLEWGEWAAISTLSFRDKPYCTLSVSYTFSRLEYCAHPARKYWQSIYAFRC